MGEVHTMKARMDAKEAEGAEAAAVDQALKVAAAVVEGLGDSGYPRVLINHQNPHHRLPLLHAPPLPALAPNRHFRNPIERTRQWHAGGVRWST